MGKAALNVAHVSLSPCCKCRTVSADQMHTTSGQLSNKSRTSAKGMLHKWRSLDLEASLLEGTDFANLPRYMHRASFFAGTRNTKISASANGLAALRCYLPTCSRIRGEWILPPYAAATCYLTYYARKK